MARTHFTLPALRHMPARRLPRPSGGVIALSFVLAVAGLAGGSALALKWQQKSDLLQQPVTRDSGRQVVESTIVKLEAEQAQLKRDLGDARARLDGLQAADSQEKEQLADVTNALAAERVGAGAVALEGPGVIATFNDSTDAAVPANEDPANYILHDYNLRDVLNTLWAAGAEAISMNGERIMATTSVYCVGPVIITNATRLSPPYEVHAIGNADALEAALRTSSQMEQLRVRAQIYDMPIDIRKGDTVAVPAYSGGIGFKYAQPGDAAVDPTATAPPPGH
jgi:uncharacterized protein YlxW (UPF0749 family)